MSKKYFFSMSKKFSVEAPAVSVSACSDLWLIVSANSLQWCIDIIESSSQNPYTTLLFGTLADQINDTHVTGDSAYDATTMQSVCISVWESMSMSVSTQSIKYDRHHYTTVCWKAIHCNLVDSLSITCSPCIRLLDIVWGKLLLILDISG